jgi:hypothetical protein
MAQVNRLFFDEEVVGVSVHELIQLLLVSPEPFPGSYDSAVFKTWQMPRMPPSKAATVVEARVQSIFVELGCFDEKRGHFDFTVDVQLKTKERSVNYVTDPTW